MHDDGEVKFSTQRDKRLELQRGQNDCFRNVY